MTGKPVDDSIVSYVEAEVSTESFERWYRREFSRLVDVLRPLGTDPSYAEEVAAEAFSRALERWDRVGAMASPTGWTYQVGSWKEKALGASMDDLKAEQPAVDATPGSAKK